MTFFYHGDITLVILYLVTLASVVINTCEEKNETPGILQVLACLLSLELHLFFLSH